MRSKPTVSATVTEGATVAVMQQRILHLLEQYQLGQEGASATNEGGMAPKVRQHPSRAFWQAAESTALWHGSPIGSSGVQGDLEWGFCIPYQWRQYQLGTEVQESS